MKYDIIKRGAVGGLMALMLMTAMLPAPRAQAATLQELQAQIQVLLAQINALQAQMGGGNTSNPSNCTPFMTDLTVGRQGTEVTALQQFLISKGHTIPAGATGYFGEQTRSALAQYQAANAIAPAVGYFGPITRAKVNAACTPVVVPPVDNSGGDTNNGGIVLQGDGSFERFDVRSGEETSLEEGQEDVSIMEVNFNVEHGDIKINRIDLGFTPESGNDEMDPWDTFTEVSVWHDGTRVARVDAGNDRNWREDEPSNGSYLLRMSGLSHVIEEGTEVELLVMVETQRNIRGSANGEIWNVFVPNDGIRGVDASNVSTYVGDEDDIVTIDIDRAGNVDELIVKRSDNDIAATTLQLKNDGRSGFLSVFAFDLDTDDSVRDIEIRKLPIELTVSTSTVGTFMRDVRLTVDGKTYTKKTITDGQTNTIVFDFSRGEFTIDAGDRVTVEVEVEFKELESQYEGTTLVGSVNTSNIVARGADNLSGNQLSGSATGETHSMYSQGVVVEVGNTTNTVTSVSGATNDYATYVIELEVTAFGQDVYIPTDVTDAVTYQLEDSNGNALVAAGSPILNSDARKSGGYYRISEGDTRTVTLEVTYQPGASLTAARLQLLTLEFNGSASAPNQSWNAVPANMFETPTRTIVD